MPVEFDEDLDISERRLHRAGAEGVVNLVESVGGRGDRAHLAPAWLETLEVPYTGCSADAMRITGDKLLARQRMQEHGVPVPGEFRPTRRQRPGDRYIIKSRHEDASIGLDAASVVGASEVAVRLAACEARHGGEWFAERYIEGREFNVALLQDGARVRALPIAEIAFEDFPENLPRIVDYRAKWEPDSFEYQHTLRRFPNENEHADLFGRLNALAVKCWNLFDLAGYARVDFRVDMEDRPWVLEVNCNPCLSPDAGYAASLERTGIGFDAAIAGILEAGGLEALPGARVAAR